MKWRGYLMRPSYSLRKTKKKFCIVVIFIFTKWNHHQSCNYVWSLHFLQNGVANIQADKAKIKKMRQKREAERERESREWWHGEFTWGMQISQCWKWEGWTGDWSVWIWVKWPFPGEWLGNWGFVVNLIKTFFESLRCALLVLCFCWCVVGGEEILNSL